MIFTAASCFFDMGLPFNPEKREAQLPLVAE